jgi:hypothetical protein
MVTFEPDRFLTVIFEPDRFLTVIFEPDRFLTVIFEPDRLFLILNDIFLKTFQMLENWENFNATYIFRGIKCIFDTILPYDFCSSL